MCAVPGLVTLRRSAWRWLFVACLWYGSIPSPAQPARVDGAFAEAIRSAQDRVVKIYGGGIGREKGYCSGVVVSPDGEIVTVSSILLDSPGLRVVLPDGRRFPVQITARDEQRQLVLLKIDATDLPCFDVDSSAQLRAGDWLIAAANPFKVADGPEQVSVSVGVFSGRAILAGRRRNQEFPYDGEVLLTDIIVSSPGSAGGGLVDGRGRLVGVIGKAVVSELTSTWMNYALPAEEVARFLRSARDGTLARSEPKQEEDVAGAEDSPTAEGIAWKTAADLGIRLFTLGGRAKPAYVESVRAGSPARRAGIRANDLILSINGRKTATCEEFDEVLRGLRGAAKLDFTIKRGEEIMILSLSSNTDDAP